MTTKPILPPAPSLANSSAAWPRTRRAHDSCCCWSEISTRVPLELLNRQKSPKQNLVHSPVHPQASFSLKTLLCILCFPASRARPYSVIWTAQLTRSHTIHGNINPHVMHRTSLLCALSTRCECLTCGRGLHSRDSLPSKAAGLIESCQSLGKR